MTYDPTQAQETSAYYLAIFGLILAALFLWKLIGWLSDFWNRLVDGYDTERVRIRIRAHAETEPSAEDALLTVDRIRAQLDQFAPKDDSPQMSEKRARLEALLSEVERRVGDKMVNPDDDDHQPPPGPMAIKNDG